MRYSCIIVDDEPLSHEVLEQYISRVPDLEFRGGFYNAMEALGFLNKNRIDILFLDINMPGLSGIEMLRTLASKPRIIFTTAYPEYAVDGFELDITDFLLKPFSFERFLKATNRAMNTQDADADRIKTKHLAVKVDKKLFRVDHEDILYLQSAGDYVKIITPEKTYIANETLKFFEHTLPAENFLRVHRSYIVAINKISYVEGNQAFVSGTGVPVGASYKEELLKRMA